LSDPESNPRSLDRIKGVDKIDRLVEVDQSAIGRSGRSNPATYSKIWDEVRKLFAQTRDARIRGFKARRFSFNAKHGRCPECAGRGTKRIQMHFLPDLFIECEVCRGARFNRQTLAIRFRGKSVADILAMRIDQAAEFFENVPRLSRMLETFCEVGLGYLCLGQSSLTLSGGEAQRVKLATELSKRGSLRTLFVLDEPTTGLHAADIARLIDVLDRLVEDGNSVLVIEHHLNLIAAADWVIDMGPEGGDAGGRVIAQGSPRELSRHEESHTALALRKHLCPDGV
jgi:excinuclease ABC subunit A